MPLLPWGKRHEAVVRAEGLLKKCCLDLGITEKRLSKSGREWITRRRWNADPSEMLRIVYYAALTAKGEEIHASHFPPRFREDHEAYSKTQFESMSLEEIVRQKLSHFFERLGTVEVSDLHRTIIAQIERPLVVECLKWTNGNQLKASRTLGINRNTLRKKIRELKIAYDK